MLMPEAAVDEENCPPFWKRQIRAPRQIVAKEAITKP
jgi:hypothetical protein